MDQIIDVEIEKLVYGGDGLARVDGRVVMLPFVLPGERVTARVTRDSGSFLRAEPLEILSPSAARESPECPYFQRCGGCQYQHIQYAEELEQKRAILREALRRIGKIDVNGEIGIVSGEPWNYRNRIQLHVANGSVGYFAAGSRRLCAIESCPIASPKLNEAIPGLRRRGETTLELFSNETEVRVNARAIEYDGLQVSRHSFFQVNRFLIPKLVETVVGDSSGESALDLYAGVGLFARALASRFSVVTAVESGQSSHRDSTANAMRGSDPWNAIRANVEEFLTGWNETADLIVADPPRAGLGPLAVRELLRLRAARLVVVSCDPATLARDLAQLTPKYSIAKITLVDLFPRTAHIETVVHLRAA